MKFLFVFIYVVSLYGSESCYTVQLISTSNSKANMSSLQSTEYPDECRVMEIGKSLTVRCGCFEKKALADKELAEYKKSYNEAVVTTTYKYRFEDAVKQIEPEAIKAEVAPDKIEEKPQELNIAVVAPLALVTDVSTEPEKQQEDKKSKKDKKKAKKEKKEDKKEKSSKKEKKDKSKKDKAKKNKNKKDKGKSKKDKDKTKEEKNKKDKKKSKDSEAKYTKKRDATFFYSKYLEPLKSKKGTRNLDYKYAFGGQFAFDYAYINEAAKSYDSSDWRRVRVYHSGSFFDETLFYEAEYSFTGTEKYKDVYIGYENSIKSIDTKYRVKFGNIKIPFSLEGYTSSKYNTFMERSLNDVFGDSRKIGGEVLLSTGLGEGRVNLFGSVFSNSIDERINDAESRPGYAGRVTYGYKFGKNHIFSLGGGIMNQDISAGEIKLKQESESAWILDKYVSVKVQDVDTLVKQNMEALYINEGFSLQAEYSSASVNALKDDYHFDAYYVQGSYFIIGNGRRYKLDTSTLAKVKPNRDGSVELAFRYSQLDLNDKDEHGGMQTDYTYGINWYISNELRLMLNYIVAQPQGTDDYDGLLQIVQGRVLFAF